MGVVCNINIGNLNILGIKIIKIKKKIAEQMERSDKINFSKLTVMACTIVIYIIVLFRMY